MPYLIGMLLHGGDGDVDGTQLHHGIRVVVEEEALLHQRQAGEGHCIRVGVREEGVERQAQPRVRLHLVDRLHHLRGVHDSGQVADRFAGDSGVIGTAL